MAARQSKEVRALLARMDDLRTLLLAFDFHLHGYEPGVSGHWQPTPDVRPRRIDLGATEWEWLEPLLRELLHLRQANADVPETR